MVPIPSTQNFSQSILRPHMHHLHNFTPFMLFMYKTNKWMLWHHRLGHPSDKVLSIAFSSIDHSVVLNNFDTVIHCRHCLSGKMHQLPFNKSEFHSTKPLELIHSDV